MDSAPICIRCQCPVDTLMHILGCMGEATAGELEVVGHLLKPPFSMDCGVIGIPSGCYPGNGGSSPPGPVLGGRDGD